MQKIAVFLVEWNESGFEYSSDQCDVLQSALRRLGHIYWYLNRPKARMYFDQAYAAIERGLSLAQEKKDTAPHTVALLILGKIDVVRKTRKRKEAQPILVNASDTLERLLPVIVRNQRVRVLRGLSETWLYLGSRSQARLFYEQADRIARTDNLRDQLLKLQGLRRRLDR
jgi:tetratricopeptide (TPR) repeat protein